MISPKEMAGLSGWSAFSSTMKSKNSSKGQDIEAKVRLTHQCINLWPDKS
jgi:hypothetical protein